MVFAIRLKRAKHRDTASSAGGAIIAVRETFSVRYDYVFIEQFVVNEIDAGEPTSISYFVLIDISRVGATSGPDGL